MRKIAIYSILSIIAILSYYKIANAQVGINNSFSGIYSIGFASTPTPAPTAAPTPTPLPLPLSLANGGTHSDLSGTGGTSQVLKQTSVGGNVSVARLACADLSDSTTTCSVAPTAAPTPTPLTTTGTGSTYVLGTSPTITTPTITGDALFGSAAGAANAVDINKTAGCITFEGATSDSANTKLCVVDPTGGAAQTYNLPNATGAFTATIATLQNDNNFSSSTITFSGSNLIFSTSSTPAFSSDHGFCLGTSCSSVTTLPRIMWDTTQTPDNAILQTGSTSNAWQVSERSDTGFDFQNGNCGTSSCTDPSLWVFSHNQNTAQWGGFWHDATNFNIKTGTGGVKITNHLILAGTAPTLSACGTSPTTVTGSDNAGHFTVGSSATTCTLTFNATWSVIPECFVNDQSAILSVLAVPTTTTITFTTAVASAISSQLISYHCVQGS